MIDHTTVTKLAALRRHIDVTGALCGDTLKAVKPGVRAAEATPFLSACADELEALAGICRKAASEAGAVRR
ncbi:MAG: hypothetical protein ACPGVA_15560 [Pikeienuella sp.]